MLHLPLRLFLLSFILLESSIFLSAQTTLNGFIRDSKTNELLIGVVVRTPSGSGVVSDQSGAFSVNTSGVGDTIHFAFLGYTDYHYAVKGNESSPLEIRMQSQSEELGVVVISAGKFEQNIGEVTVSMEVIKPKLLEDKNVVLADEVLQQTPGVSIVDGEPQIRSGSGYSFGAGSRVQILVDDLPLLSGDAGRPSWGFFPVENISQIEVIKGASSVLYGSAALSGVINMRTAYPTDTSLTKVTLYYGAYSAPESDSARYWTSTPQRVGVNFLHSQKFGPLDLVIGGSYLGDDGHLGPMKDSTGNFEDRFNPFTVDRFYATNRGRVNVNLRYRDQHVEGLSYGINTNWSQSNALATLLWENSTTGLYGAYDGSATRTIQLLGTVDPYITYFNKSGSKHSLRGRWQTLDNDNDNNQGNFSDVYYGEYQYQQDWSPRGIADLTTTLGAVAISTDARGQLFTGGRADGRNEAHNYAAFFQADKKFFKKLNVSIGVRYEYFDINKASDSKPVFRAGANYQLAKASYLRASFGQGFRFPSIAEKFIVTGVGAINIIPNPDLIAETSYNAEIGFKQGFKIGNFLGFADVAAFYQHYNNFIEFTFGQWNKPVFGVPGETLQDALQKSFGFKSVNTGEAAISGFETSIMGEGKIGAVKWTALVGYTYTKPISLTPNYVYGVSQSLQASPISYITTSSDTSNHILKYRMQHLIRADIGADYKKWMAGVSFRYNSHMQNIDNAFQILEEELPFIFNPGINQWRANHTTGDYVFDIRLGYTFTPHQRLSVAINNVLNREYAIRPLAIEEMRITMLQYTLTF